MAYVAARGGEQAILEAENLYRELLGTLSLERVKTIEETLPYLLDRVMGEASIYAPELAIASAAMSIDPLLVSVARALPPPYALASCEMPT